MNLPELKHTVVQAFPEVADGAHVESLPNLAPSESLRLRQAEMALRESNERYRDLYEFAPLGYLTLTPGGRIAEANITAASLLGVERDELHAATFDRFVAAEDRERWQYKFAGVMAHGGLQGFDLGLGADAAGEAVAYAQVVCLRVETVEYGKPTYVLRMTLVDISEKKRLYEELEQYRHHLDALVQSRTAELLAARDAADAASRARRAFLATVSHELRTPMNALLGLARVLRRSGVSAGQGETLDKIDASSRHMVRLIDDVLDLDRIDAGKLLFEYKHFVLSEMLGAVCAIVGESISAKGLAFSIDIAGLPQALHGDPTRLAQMLVNYLANAAKFTERGGISLTGRLLEDDQDSCRIRFAVRDTGIGLSNQQQASVFEAFAPADGSSSARNYGACGLGLALTRRIAQLMGGEVGVDSVPGQGSTFWLDVRLDKGTAVAADLPAPGSPDSQSAVVSSEDRLRREHRGARILLVDDDALTREVMLMMLGGLGLALDLACDGVEALALAQENDYALILMDLQMPRMDGLVATRTIRALPGRQATPILAMTADVLDDSLQACRSAGMNDCLLKPLDPDLLFEALINWLAK
jgi:two-component system sensor histidine kinase/response regulator